MLKSFGFSEYQVFLSTRPERYAGTIDIWEQATETLRRALLRLELPYTIDPGEGVFYGPKIDIVLKDALGRGWQGPTIQVDFNLPERFDLNYIGEDGREHRVAMIHRTVLGSMERFLGCLIEHYGGAFPIWLAPVQAVIIPIAERHLEYARRVEAELQCEGTRIQLDGRNERMNLKIREAQQQKVPYMLIVGDEEEKSSTVTVRLRTGENLKAQPLSTFKAQIKAMIESKGLL
jgi:threonyl-tRNA synthetase